MAAQNSGKPAVRGRPFQKGEDSRRNKGGRPKNDPAVTEIIASGGVRAAQYMVQLVQDEDAKPSDRLNAAEYLLDRLLGKATQPIQADVFESEVPLTLDEMFTVAEEVLHGTTGGSATP